jgi:hypothetical protein
VHRNHRCHCIILKPLVPIMNECRSGCLAIPKEGNQKLLKPFYKFLEGICYGKSATNNQDETRQRASFVIGWPASFIAGLARSMDIGGVKEWSFFNNMPCKTQQSHRRRGHRLIQHHKAATPPHPT